MQILYSDNEIVVCVKPIGVDAEHEMPQQLKQRLGGEIYTLHRLDKNVGGVMVYGRTKSAAAFLSKQIQDNKMIKEYVALVHGTPPEAGEWEDLLFKDSRKNKVFVVNRKRAGVKEAKLAFSRHTAGETSLVLIRLYTGRSHQIRVQFSNRGFPLVGDHKYGSRAKEAEPMLFSCRLRFTHHGQEQVFSALPEWAEDIDI